MNPIFCTFSGLPINQAFCSSNLSLTYFLVMSKNRLEYFFSEKRGCLVTGLSNNVHPSLASAFSHQTSHIIKCMHAHNKTFLLGEKIRERARVLEMARDLFISKEEEHYSRSASRLQVRGVCGHKIGSLRLWLCLYSFSCFILLLTCFPSSGICCFFVQKPWL